MKSIIKTSIHLLGLLICSNISAQQLILPTDPDFTPIATDLVQLTADGTLSYTADANGNTLIDYGMVGYHQGVCSLPDVPTVMTLNPSSGDRTADIQAAIDAIEAMPQNGNGHRGTLLLKEGTYQLNGELTINASGVVIRGEGNDTDGTILRHVGTSQVSVLTIAASSSVQKNSSTLKNITDTYVPIGTKEITVEAGHSFQVGDNIVVTRIPTQLWLETLGMDDLATQCGEGHSDWTTSNYSIESKHNITAVIGNTLYMDTPIVDPIGMPYSSGTVQKYDWVGIQECGVENIRFESQAVSETDENHANYAINMLHLRDSWFKNINSKDFINSLTLINSCYQITVDSCEVEDYKSIVTGGRRYGFTLAGRSQLILVKNCKSNNGRHCFASSSAVKGPNVFFNCTSTNATADNGPHHRWATGFLWEHIDTDLHLWVQNRVCSGSGHGWAGGQHMLWNCNVGGSIILHDPPTDQTNWAVGCTTNSITNVGAFNNFVGDLGYVESQNTPIAFSLYLQQALDYQKNNNSNYMDTDQDGVCDAEDKCENSDDRIDNDANGVPDFCECDTVLASLDDGNAPINTLDGDLSTRWSAFGLGHAIQFCLDTPTPLSCIDIAFYRGDTRMAIFDVELLTDNDTWVKVLDNAASSGTTLGLERFTFPTTTTHKIRITGYGNSTNDWNSFTEVKWKNTCTPTKDVTLDLKIMLKGTHNGVDMDANLTDVLSSEHPYDESIFINIINGTDQIPDPVPADFVDWVIVSIRTDETTVLYHLVGIVKTDGTIVSPDNIPLIIQDLPTGNYYVSVQHRNHLGVMTQTAITIN